MQVYIGGAAQRLDASNYKDKGGEAEIYRVGPHAIKIYKRGDHPDYAMEPGQQKAAERRIAIQQRKLPDLMRLTLPSNVVKPETLVTDKSGRTILGFRAPFLDGIHLLYSLSDRDFRKSVADDLVLDVFRGLHGLVGGVHTAGGVIGDFNPFNVPVRGTDVYLLDTDSMQFGSYLSETFSPRFLDPLHAEPQKMRLGRPYVANCDWYAFAVMLMECLVFAHPYAGVFLPKKGRQMVKLDDRPLHRISVFDPDVKYPKPAIPLSVLPDELLQLFEEIFAKDRRGEFPRHLLDAFRWTTCSSCGARHARPTCPQCAFAAPAALKAVVTSTGAVEMREAFRTTGVILFTTVQDGQLRIVHHEGGLYKREDGSTIFPGDLEPHLRFRIRGDATLVGKGTQVYEMTLGAAPDAFRVDTVGALPIFDANARHRYWTEGGTLWRDDTYAPFRIGGVLSGQTHVWAGPDFGFGFYRASDLSVAFLFDAEGRGVNDQVKLPAVFGGQILDLTTLFGKDRCWFFVSSQEGGSTVNRCFLIRRDGTVLAHAETTAGDGSWLSSIRGACAAGHQLFVPTDDGVVRVEAQGTAIAPTKTFTATEPWVSSSSKLFINPKEGIYVVGLRSVRVLTT